MEQTMKYGDWHIEYDPPPIPTRQFDWHYWHDDYDGAEDACDNRHGSVASLEIAMQEIDDYEGEEFDEKGCSYGCPMASALDCKAVDYCRHRDGLKLERMEA
jgi:hypothetical protein